jgi:hypothetical protein
VRDLELLCPVPAGLIEDDDGVGAGGNLAGDLVEMKLHGLAATRRAQLDRGQARQDALHLAGDDMAQSASWANHAVVAALAELAGGDRCSRSWAIGRGMPARRPGSLAVARDASLSRGNLLFEGS